MSIIKQLLKVRTMARNVPRYLKKGYRETAYSSELTNWRESFKAGKHTETERWDSEWNKRYGISTKNKMVGHYEAHIRR